MCPDAHLLKTSAPGYKEEAVHSWYDFRNGECESADDEPILQTLESSRHEIQKIIKSEAGIVGIGNVFLGGVSQGCGTAFHSLSTLPLNLGKIGGIYGSIGHVMPCTDVSGIHKRINGPFVFYSGTDDDVMNWSWVKHSFARLQDIPRVEIWREDGVKHEDDGHFIGFFLLRVMPPPTVKEQLCAYDERDQKKNTPSIVIIFPTTLTDT